MAFCFSVSRPFPPSKFSHLEISEPQESLRHAKNRQKDYLNPSRLKFSKFHRASNDPLSQNATRARGEDDDSVPREQYEALDADNNARNNATTAHNNNNRCRSGLTAKG